MVKCLQLNFMGASAVTIARSGEVRLPGRVRFCWWRWVKEQIKPSHQSSHTGGSQNEPAQAHDWGTDTRNWDNAL